MERVTMNRTMRVRQILQFLRFQPFDTSTVEGRSRERYRLIALTSSSNLISKFVISLIGLVSVPLTINYLGKEQFGLWMVVSSLVVWIQLADFGISNGLVNALSEANGKDDRDAAQAYIATALVAISAISILCFLPLVVLVSRLNWASILNLSGVYLPALASKCFLVAGLVIVFGFPISVISKIYVAFQLGYMISILQVLSSLCSLGGILISIYFELDLPWLVFLVSIGPVFGNLISWFLIKKHITWYKLNLQLVSRSALNRVLSSSIPLFLFQIGALLVTELVNVVIARVGTLTMVADYNILLRIYMLYSFVAVSLSSPFYPAIREAFEKRELNWVRDSIKRAFIIRIGVLFLLSFPLLAIGDWLITIWIRQQLESSFGLLGWISFMLCLIFAGTSSGLSEILISLDDIWSQIKIVFTSALVTLLGICLLIRVIGLSSVYVAWSLSTIYPIYYLYGKLQTKLEHTNQ